MNKPKLYIGVDPGKSGGISWINEQGGVFYAPMPPTERDIWELMNHTIRADPASFRTGACIEWINTAIPRISKSTMSKLYGSYMQLRGFLIAANIPFEHTKPRDWQKAFGISPRGKSETTYKWKCRLSATAQEIYPSLSLWEHWTKVEQLKVADAILIATYYKRKLEGIL